MDCNECLRLDRMFLESLVAADQAETALRCYFLTHQRSAGVGDLDEYSGLRGQEQQSAEKRDRAYLASVEHRKQHA